MPKISDDRKQQKREMIIDTAFELFAANGYSATSMRDIMAACKMSKGGLYVYFDSKMEILRSIIQRFDQRKVDYDTCPTASAGERLTVYLTNRLKSIQDGTHQKYVRIAIEFWGFLQNSGNMTQIRDERFDQYPDVLTQIIQKGIENGEFSSQFSVPGLVYHINCSANGAGILSSYMGSVITDEEIEIIVASHLEILTGHRKENPPA